MVAGEVKALSSQTAKATEEIGAQIAAMQGATERSIQAIAGIERTIREIGEISGAIATAVTEQGAATQEIARSVEVAARRTNDTADEVVARRRGDGEHARQRQSVKTLADDLAAAAGQIRAQVDQFFAQATRVPDRSPVNVLASNALAMCRGILPGATRITSKRMKHWRRRDGWPARIRPRR